MNGENYWRFSILGALVSVLPVLIIVQLVRLQANPEQADALLKMGAQYEGQYQTIQPVRGQIYDRWGHLLAGNRTVYEVGVELKDVKNPETIALTLGVVLGTEYSKIYTLASQEASPNRVYAVLANQVQQDKIDQLNELKTKMEDTYAGSSDPNAPSLRGLVYTPRLARSYPERSLASNLLGFVNHEGRGYFGVEEKYNNQLAGKAKSVWVSVDPNEVEELPEVPDGASLILTINREVQAMLESVLDEAIAETGSASGTIVVLEPSSGEIMGMATTPRLDLNEYNRYFDIFTDETPFNRAVSQAYEPGSVYKVLTMAAGLDSGAVSPETPFLDTGFFEVGGTVIRNWNLGAWGPQNMTGCMQHSLNVCLAWIASQVGAHDFYAYMEEFGIGHSLGVDMAGEVTGRLKVPGDADWYEADLGTNSFGQGVAATPLQMAAAISAVANDGKVMAPHIVRSIINKGYQYDVEQRVISTPLKPETGRVLTEMLAHSLETESSDALVPGYRVAGKTGTAEIPTPFGYTSNETNASFVGWGPVDDPRFLVYIWLERPSTSMWGSVVAAPVFARVVEELVVLIDLPPDDVRRQLMQELTAAGPQNPELKADSRPADARPAVGSN